MHPEERKRGKLYSRIGSTFSPTYMYLSAHKCPICDNELSVIKVTKYVAKTSPEAEKWNFSVGGRTYWGDALFTIHEFFCTNCHNQVGEDRLIRIENKIPDDFNEYKPPWAIVYVNNADVEYIYVTTKKKKKYCPECGKSMISTYDYKIIDSNSPEAKDYDFTIGGKQIEGRIEFRDGYFWCPNKKCDKKISFTDMKKLETGSY